MLDLGEQALTGVFPRRREDPVTVGPLRLVWCPESGLLQLAHSYDLGEMYGENYGYRSGLNRSMVEHLTQKVRELERLADLEPGATVLDIGSNDATSLKAYSTPSLKRVGIDPTGAKFRQYYPDDITLVPDFFSAAAFRATGAAPAAIVTSIAMFYDLEDPVAFAREVESVLAPGGVWHFEQSYMPSMLRLNSYDTICHEHLEYYSLGVVNRILEQAGMRAVDVKMNAVNGGSFAVTAVRRDDRRRGSEAVVAWLLEQEERMGLAHAAALPRLRGARVPPPRRPRAAAGGAQGRRQDRARLRRLDQGQRGAAVLRHRPGPAARDRRGERGQVRRLHAGHRHPDRLRGGGARHAARLLPRAALALQATASCAARPSSSRAAAA